MEQDTVDVGDKEGTGSEDISNLKDLGLSDPEARIYLTLVIQSHLTVTDISREAEVPMSKIYGVLAGLETGGWISVIPERPKKYGAIDPRTAIEHACRQAISRHEQSRDILLERLGPLFDQQTAGKQPPEFQVIHGSVNIVNRVREILGSPAGEILIHLAFVSPQAAKKVISLVEGNPGNVQVIIINEPDTLVQFSEISQNYPAIRLIEAPGSHTESIMFIYTDKEGLYCSLHDDEFVMALSIYDQGFLGMIRKFGEIAHPQLLTQTNGHDLHDTMFKAHKAMLTGSAKKLLKRRKSE